MSKTACILGANGQDGRLLTDYLTGLGYGVVGVERSCVRSHQVNWSDNVNITAQEDVFRLVRELRPDEVYHLAVVHQSSEGRSPVDLDFFRRSYEVNFFSLLNFLEAIRQHSPTTRLFYAASSHVFGGYRGEGSPIRSEQTPLKPESVYAMTKVDGLLACRQYREQHKVYASVGVLFNHESSLRAPSFLSSKVVRAAVAIAEGEPVRLPIGDLDAEVDWGYAGDFVEAMHASLQPEISDEYVLATGKCHTVRDFIVTAFEHAGVGNWQGYVDVDARHLQRRQRGAIGDSSKLRNASGWSPRTSFSEMIRNLIAEERARRTRTGSN